MTGSPVAKVLSRLGSVRKSGDSYMAQCPAHDDGNASLSVSEGDDGRALLKCHAGCELDTILTRIELDLPDLFPPKSSNGVGKRIDTTYDYTDESGALLFQVVRMVPKAFWQRRPDGKGGWINKTKGVRRVLYRLPDVIAAVADGRRIYVVEGEKDADAVIRAGEVATCGPHGAGEWSKVPDAGRVLAGATVTVVADKDEPGREHAAQVAADLRQHGCSVTVVEAKHGKDAVDHLAAGHAITDFVPVDLATVPTGTVAGSPAPHGAGEPGDALLDDVADFLRKYVAYPSTEALTASALWTAAAHLLDAFESTPRLAHLSPEPGSGKTRALEVLELLTPRPMHALSASAPAIFRSIEKNRPTLLMDECDALFGKRGDDSAEDLRALLNAGHRKGATIPRCVGPTHEVRQFPVYATVALAGLGDLPETLMSRSVVLRMRRRAPNEQVTSFRRRLAQPEGHALRDRLAAWAATVFDEVELAWPEMPDGVTDRPADVWEPLLAVADAAGGEWPEKARAACSELTKANVAREASLGVRLLLDLRSVFGEHDVLSTEEMLKKLHAIEESPWDDLRGRPLDARGLARRLGAYGISSTKVKFLGDSLRGYRREDLWDAWQRYLPALDPGEAEPAEPAEPSTSEASPEVPLPMPVPEPPSDAEPSAPPLTSTVPEVPEVPHLQEPECDPYRCHVCGQPVTPAPGSVERGWATTCSTCSEDAEAVRAVMAR
jgi:hypothetical protein